MIPRGECAVLSLVLKTKWYDMIKSGTKREEYRDATDYWAKRLWNWNLAFKPGKIPVVEFRLGYGSNAPRMAFWTLGRSTVSGMLPFSFHEGKPVHPEWGEPATPRFIIEIGGPVVLTEV